MVSWETGRCVCHMWPPRTPPQMIPLCTRLQQWDRGVAEGASLSVQVTSSRVRILLVLHNPS